MVPRVKKRKDFVRCAKEGVKVVASTLVLQVLPDAVVAQATGSPRVGFTVTKKTGNAVVRNRIRRRLRSAVEELFPPHAAAYDYVVIGRATALEADYAIIRRDLKYAIKKAHKLLAEGGAPSHA